MSDSKTGNAKPPNHDTPTVNLSAAWRDVLVRSEAAWSNAATQWLQDEHTGKAFIRQLDEARVLHRLYTEAAQAGLGLANLPSRTDLEMLDERLGRVEDGLASVAAALYRLREALSAEGVHGASLSRPRRDRKAPLPPVPTQREGQRAGGASGASSKRKPSHGTSQRKGA